MTLSLHKTKIVATIGPASQAPAVLEGMIRAGMRVARLNFSHGDFATHLQVIQNLRAASKAVGRRVAIMADLCGPKMRIGSFATESITLQNGDSFTLSTDEITGDQTRVSVSFKRLPQVVKPGDGLYLNDGYVQLEVIEVRGNNVVCLVKAGGELRARKGLNLPSIDLGISAFTEQDHEALRFSLEHGVDAVSQSFVESAADVRAVREAARALGHQPFIIAKIERSGALDRLDEILDVADGIMIARGDLGVEVPIERIAVIQKDIMRRANQRARPVITATQMLESMTTNRLPTRAEATDVSNAILDGTDAVMLSGESAVGRYPVEAVGMLAKIAGAVEPTRRRIPVREMYQGVQRPSEVRPEHLIAMGVEASFEHASPAAVLAPTVGGTSARRISALRLPVWTVAVSPREKTCQDLQFAYGVAAIHETSPPAAWTDYAKKWAREAGLAGQLVVLAAGPSPQHPDANHRMELIAT